MTPLLEALSSAAMFDDWLMQDLPDVLGAVGSAAVAPLIAFAADRSRDLYARMTAVDGLGPVGRRLQAAELRRIRPRTRSSANVVA